MDPVLIHPVLSLAGCPDPEYASVSLSTVSYASKVVSRTSKIEAIFREVVTSPLEKKLRQALLIPVLLIRRRTCNITIHVVKPVVNMVQVDVLEFCGILIDALNDKYK